MTFSDSATSLSSSASNHTKGLAAFIANGANEGNAILRPARQLGPEGGARGERTLGLFHGYEPYDGLAVTRDQNFLAVIGVMDQLTESAFAVARFTIRIGLV